MLPRAHARGDLSSQRRLIQRAGAAVGSFRVQLVVSAEVRSHVRSVPPPNRKNPATVLNAPELRGSLPPHQQVGDYLGGRAARRFAGTTLRCLVTGFLVSAASNNCRNPCANSPTAFPKAPSCPTRTIATDRCRSNDGGRNTFTGSIELFLAIKRAGSSPTP